MNSKTKGASAFHGIYAMQYAFFDSEGALDREAMATQVKTCIEFGVDGIAILGLGTEVGKLARHERHQLLEWTAASVKGRVPLAVTAAESTVQEQIAFAKAADAAGAGLVILQPPPKDQVKREDLLPFFSQIMDQAPLAIGVQNAPEYLGIGLEPAEIVELSNRHANFMVLKGEAPAVSIQQIIEQLEGRLAVFNGRGGLELTDNARAGCAGLIPASESCDIQKKIFDLAISADRAAQREANSLYAELLPLIVFQMQSVDHLLCYGKRLAAARLGIERINSREPALAATPFGIECLRHAAAGLWPDLMIR